MSDPSKQRALGRIEESRWKKWQRAKDKEGLTFTSWAIKYLDAAAKRTLKRKEQ